VTFSLQETELKNSQGNAGGILGMPEMSAVRSRSHWKPVRISIGNAASGPIYGMHQLLQLVGVKIPLIVL
jgi:hypothetical protein